MAAKVLASRPAGGGGGVDPAVGESWSGTVERGVVTLARGGNVLSSALKKHLGVEADYRERVRASTAEDGAPSLDLTDSFELSLGAVDNALTLSVDG